MGFAPKVPRNGQGIDAVAVPPVPLIAGGMIFGVMDGAEWHGEFVAHFKGYAFRLCVADVMGMRRGAPTDEAGLAPDVAQMLL